jgi:lantibiotic biosynthesis protein
VNQAAYGAAEQLAGYLTDSDGDCGLLPGTEQSLTRGAAGVALLHIERALAGLGSWRTVHEWVVRATRQPLVAGPRAGIHHGVPALAFVLHEARSDGIDRYDPAHLRVLDAAVDDLVHSRADESDDRMSVGAATSFDEYDIFTGLTGIGAHLLHHRPGGDALLRVLTYLVRLTRPQDHAGSARPGWWVAHSPQGTGVIDAHGGHANVGMAHGISGPLALLARAMRAGVVVDGHAEAIDTICVWLDRWRHETLTGPVWPEFVGPGHHEPAREAMLPNRRPSWCYGTPGVARAQQLAGVAIGDLGRKRLAERALTGCIADEFQLDQVPDSGLCHGWAGLYLTTRYAAGDEPGGLLAGYVARLADLLVHRASTQKVAGGGLLEGTAGVYLTLHELHDGRSPTSGWDTWLLIT